MQEINNFLDTEIVRRSQHWNRLKHILEQALPEEFFEQVNYATLNDGKLTIFSNSPAWSSRYAFTILKLLKFSLNTNRKSSVFRPEPCRNWKILPGQHRKRNCRGFTPGLPKCIQGAYRHRKSRVISRVFLKQFLIVLRPDVLQARRSLVGTRYLQWHRVANRSFCIIEGHFFPGFSII